MHMPATKMPVVKKKSSKKKLPPAQAERKMMAAAQKCRIVVELSDEQMAAFAKQYCSLNPAEGMELTFTLKKSRGASKSKDAEDSWAGDTL
jgi:hypothetical protein